MEEGKQNTTKSDNKDKKLETLTKLIGTMSINRNLRLSYKDRDEHGGIPIDATERERLEELPMYEQAIEYLHNYRIEYKKSRKTKPKSKRKDLNEEENLMLEIQALKLNIQVLKDLIIDISNSNCDAELKQAIPYLEKHQTERQHQLEELETKRQHQLEELETERKRAEQEQTNLAKRMSALTLSSSDKEKKEVKTKLKKPQV